LNTPSLRPKALTEINSSTIISKQGVDRPSLEIILPDSIAYNILNSAKLDLATNEIIKQLYPNKSNKLNQLNSLKECANIYIQYIEYLYSILIEFNSTNNNTDEFLQGDSFKEFNHFLPLIKIISNQERFRIWNVIAHVKAFSSPDIERDRSQSALCMANFKRLNGFQNS
jgi:hypothetical protein